jgi:hypothetical protein
MHCNLPYLTCKEKVINPPTQVNLVDNDFGIVFELSLFATNIHKEMLKGRNF